MSRWKRAVIIASSALLTGIGVAATSVALVSEFFPDASLWVRLGFVVAVGILGLPAGAAVGASYVARKAG